MEKQYKYILVLTFIIVIFLGISTFASCFIAESKKTQVKDLKVDGKLCYLPRSHAYNYGVAALVCLGIAHVVGNMQVCGNFCSRQKRSDNKTTITPPIVTFLVVFSWMCFGVAVILITTATSMSMRQPYGLGWLEGECYLVKDGVFIGSGGLALVSLGSILVAAFLTRRKSYIEQCRRKNAQAGYK